MNTNDRPFLWSLLGLIVRFAGHAPSTTKTSRFNVILETGGIILCIAGIAGIVWFFGLEISIYCAVVGRVIIYAIDTLTKKI